MRPLRVAGLCRQTRSVGAWRSLSVPWGERLQRRDTGTPMLFMLPAEREKIGLLLDCEGVPVRTSTRYQRSDPCIENLPVHAVKRFPFSALHSRQRSWGQAFQLEQPREIGLADELMRRHTDSCLGTSQERIDDRQRGCDRNQVFR